MNGNSHGTAIHRAGDDKADRDIDLADVLEEYLADLERGSAPNREKLLACHPGIADQLARCLDGLEVSWRMSAKFRDDSSDGSSQDCVDGPKQFGDFRILRELGRGGMGVVYEAQQISLPRRVALKVLPFAAVLDPRQLERFKNEARAAATLNHPAIVSIYSVGCERAVHFYAMQLIEGQSLAEVIAQLRGDPGGGPTNAGTEPANGQVHPRWQRNKRIPGRQGNGRARRRRHRCRPGRPVLRPRRRWTASNQREAQIFSVVSPSWEYRRPMRWITPTPMASSIATSSRAICSWIQRVRFMWPTLAWRGLKRMPG